MLTVVSEKPTAGRDEVAVTLRVQLSREQLTAALYNMVDPDAENLATAALVRSEVACALVSGSGTPDDLAHTGQWTRRAYADGQLKADEAAWWALCWRRVGEVFFSVPAEDDRQTKTVTPLAQLRADRGWKRLRVVKMLRAAAVRLEGADLGASDESLLRQLAAWENGHRPVGEFYRRLFAAVYEVPAWQLETTMRPESGAPAQLRPVRTAAPFLDLVAA